MRTLIINSSSLVDNGLNDTFKYTFPVGNAIFKDNQVAVSNIALYYSWFNITSASSSSGYNNNSFSYQWINNTTYTITLPDGYYAVSDINAYLQSQMVSNGHYLVDGNGDYVYYIELVENSTYYGVSINLYPVPTSLPSGYSNPASMSFPVSTRTPKLIISSSNDFYKVIGFSSGTYPSSNQSTTQTFTSDLVPQVSPVSSVILSCSLLNNKLANPSTLLFSFSPANTDFGSLIDVRPSQMTFVDIQDGSYPDFEIRLFDQDLNRIAIKDPNIVIMLVIN